MQQVRAKKFLGQHFLTDLTVAQRIAETLNPVESQKSKVESQQWHIVDLPGYGYARASQTQRDNLRRMIERYCLLREQLCNLFVLVDSRLEAQKIDIEFMNWLGEQQIPFSIVFTKADKLGRERLKENVEAYKKVLQETWEELPPIFITSAEKNQGGEEIVQYIEEINGKLRVKSEE